MNENELFTWEPSIEAIQEVIQVHKQLDPVSEPLVLSMASELLISEQCYEREYLQ